MREGPGRVGLFEGGGVLVGGVLLEGVLLGGTSDDKSFEEMRSVTSCSGMMTGYTLLVVVVV